MPKALVIAEKPSVAADLARALGKVPKKNDLFENDEFVITSAIGHLVELCLPGEMEKKRGKWSFTNLPIIPDHFELKPIEKTQARFNLIKRLLKRSDVDEVINACDAGREGELIFHYLLKLAGNKKPTRRLWLQSMTAEAIRDGFAALRAGAEMTPLADAAVCRSESDWLVGINGTRAMTAFNSKGGGFQLTPVGRVQTPTLAILAEREVNIRDFKSRTYFEVFGDFDVLTGAGSPSPHQTGAGSPSPIRPKAIAAVGSTNILRRMVARTRGPNAFGKSSKPRLLPQSALGSAALSRRRRSRPPRFRLSSMTSPRSSAKPIRASR